eukprot:scaffold1881_cov256-Pinguiococcus_pyrenoidosus.AAC.6
MVAQLQLLEVAMLKQIQRMKPVGALVSLLHRPGQAPLKRRDPMMMVVLHHQGHILNLRPDGAQRHIHSLSDAAAVVLSPTQALLRAGVEHRVGVTVHDAHRRVMAVLVQAQNQRPKAPDQRKPQTPHKKAESAQHRSPDRREKAPKCN